jgi:hypothetical protein
MTEGSHVYPRIELPQLPEAVAAGLIELVVDHVRDKLLRGLNLHPILRVRKQAEAEQRHYERCS